MSQPTDRFGIGSLAAYDELLSPMVTQAQLLGTANYLAGVDARQRQAQQSVQQPTAAQSLMPTVPTLEEEYAQRRQTYRDIMGDPEQQRNMTQAQMLFDIANTALAFSTAGSRPGMSPAERLAEAAVETKLFPTISARAAAQQEQQQKFDLAALQSAETSLSAKQKAAADYREAMLKQGKEYEAMIYEVDGQTFGPFNVKSALGRRQLENVQAKYPGGDPYKVGTKPDDDDSPTKGFVTMVDPDAQNPASTAVYLDLNDPKDKARHDELKGQGFVPGGKASLTADNVPDPTFGKDDSSILFSLLGDPATATRYAEGTLDPKLTAEINGKIGELTATQVAFDETRGINVRTPGLVLPEELMRTIELRRSRGLTVPTISGADQISAINPTAAETADPVEVEMEVGTPQFNQSLRNPDGSIDLDAPNWRRVPTTLFDSKIRYQRSTGIGEAFQRLSNYFTENLREVAGTAPMGEEGREIVQADRDLTNLRNTLMLEMTNLSDDRVLKFVQEMIVEDVEKLTPGLFTSDEKALGTLSTLRKSYGKAWANGAQVLPEYGGDPSGYTEAQITRTRINMNKLTSILGELTAFEDSYRTYLEGLSGGVQAIDRSAAKDMVFRYLSGQPVEQGQ